MWFPHAPPNREICSFRACVLAFRFFPPPNQPPIALCLVLWIVDRVCYHAGDANQYEDFSLCDPDLLESRINVAYGHVLGALPTDATLVLLGISGGATVAAALSRVRLLLCLLGICENMRTA